MYASIPPIPPAKAPALLDDYMDFLTANAERLSGIAIYNIFPGHPITQYLPAELASLPILLVPPPLTPHDILAGILTNEIGEFTAGGMVTAMSDHGISLEFRLDTEGQGSKVRLGTDLFDPENQESMVPLVEGCQCFTCKNHHRAYIHHLLKCHEMTAWVLLQMFSPHCGTANGSHNFHILDLFFQDIRRAIENGILPELVERFNATYSTEEIIKAGSRGPRVRGHHTALRREQKKHKRPIATNKGLVGKNTSVFSGGEVIEQEGKRKHWRQFSDQYSTADEGMEIVDEEENIEGELLPEGEVNISIEDDPDQENRNETWEH